MAKSANILQRRYRTLLLAGTTSLALSLPAGAQSMLEEVVVTASKRPQTLQDIPVAVSVTSEETVEQAAVLDLGDLQSIVPSLRVTSLQASTNTTFSIRGFGNGANNTGIEPSVGVFIDGVYRSRAGAAIGNLPRLQRIEVLRGPQSTLFGKNASAGVISIVTQAPSFDPEGKIEVGIGNYNQRLMKAYYTNGISDNLAFSVSGGFNTRDGYIEATTPGLSDQNDRDRWNIRSQVLFEPTDTSSFRLIMDYSEIDEICCGVSAGANGLASDIITALGGDILLASDPFNYKAPLNKDPENTVEDGGISLTAKFDFENFNLTSITAYRENKSSRSFDADYTGLDILEAVTQDLDIKTFTQEIRFASNGGGDVDWMVGGYFFTEEIEENGSVLWGTEIRNYFDFLADLLAPGVDAFGLLEAITGNQPGEFFNEDVAIIEDFTQDNDAYSIFATTDIHLNDFWTATLGVSYTNDEKEVTAVQSNNSVYSALDLDTIAGGAFAVGKPFQFVPPLPVFPNSVEDGKTNDSKTTWSVRLAYEINDNVNVYASAATGYKATSWNLSRDTRPFISDQAGLEAAGLIQPNMTYGTRYAGPEESTVVELGAKMQFDTFALNLALFDQSIEGFQSAIFQGTGFVLANAGEQSTKGLEFDATWAPTENWVFAVAGTLLDPVYDDFVGASGIDGPIDLTGAMPAGVHEQSISANATYNMEFDNGTYGFVRADYLYESEVQLVANLPDNLKREVGTFNASAGLTFTNGVEAKVWVRNLNNDEYFLSGFPGVAQIGNFYVYPNQPRTFGATVSYSF